MRISHCYHCSFLLLALLLVSACSSFSDDDTASAEEGYGSLASRTIGGTFRSAADAVKSPFIDLNFTRKEIPDQLAAVADDPYARPQKQKNMCRVMEEELAILDEALGPDPLRNPDPNAKDKTRAQKAAGMMQEGAVGFVAGKANILPLRGIVREVTGAAKHSKKLAKAFESGKLRRAYLHGMRTALHCSPEITLAKAP